MRKLLGWLSILVWVALCLSVSGAADDPKKQTSPTPKKTAAHKASKKTTAGKAGSKSKQARNRRRRRAPLARPAPSPLGRRHPSPARRLLRAPLGGTARRRPPRSGTSRFKTRWWPRDSSTRKKPAGRGARVRWMRSRSSKRPRTSNPPARSTRFR